MLRCQTSARWGAERKPGKLRQGKSVCQDGGCWRRGDGCARGLSVWAFCCVTHLCSPLRALSLNRLCAPGPLHLLPVLSRWLAWQGKRVWCTCGSGGAHDLGQRHTPVLLHCPAFGPCTAHSHLVVSAADLQDVAEPVTCHTYAQQHVRFDLRLGVQERVPQPQKEAFGCPM